MNLAKALAKRHGYTTIAREESGIHLQMASPLGLDEDGMVELTKRHLYVNADKYFGLGKWRNLFGTYDADLVANDIKRGIGMKVSDLLSMVPLEERGYRRPVFREDITIKADKVKFLRPDGKGNMIPDDPGDTLPVNELPSWHESVRYLKDRGFDPDLMVKFCEMSWCFKEKPEDRVLGRFYGRTAGGFKKTPQGRLIFYCYINGVRVGWQARVLDRTTEEGKFYYHPYQKQWVQTHVRIAGELVPLPGYEKENFDPGKYVNGLGCTRNAMMIGMDHAIKWNNDNPSTGARTVILTEGPLDAARLAAWPSVAILGKYLSDTQAAHISKNFDRVLYAMDNDEAGNSSLGVIMRKLADKDLVQVTIPKPYKDPGEMPQNEADKMILSYI